MRLDELFEATARESSNVAMRVRELEDKNNRELTEQHGLDESYAAPGSISRVALDQNPWRGQREDITAEELTALQRSRFARDLVSFAVGCMFGRYSLDKQGLILADQGSTLASYLEKVPHPSFEPDADNVIPLVDGDWFDDDVVERFRQFLRVAFGERHFAENLRFVSEALNVRNVRDYFVRSFYDDHVQRYKKRPIYWLFSTPTGSFSALIYIHRYTPSTVSTVLNEYLREYQAKLKAGLDHAERANNAKESDRLRRMLLELDEYEHNVLYPLASTNVTIDLDDGVRVNYAKFGSALRPVPGLEASE